MIVYDSISLNHKNLISNLEKARMLNLVKLLKLLLFFYKGHTRRYFESHSESELFTFFVANLIGEKYFGYLLNDSEKHHRAIAKSWKLIKKGSKYYSSYLDNLISKQIYKIYTFKNYEIEATNIKTKKIKLNPPQIQHSDLKRNRLGRKPFYVTTNDLGIVEIRRVYGVLGSNSFIDSVKSIYVDEYRPLYSQDNDPKNEPFIREVFKDSALVDVALLAKLSIRKFECAFWLAGPMFVEWGHFVNTYLIKLINYLDHPEFSKIPVIVPGNLPNNIEYVLRRIVPEQQLIFISKNEKIWMERCMYFPSTVFSPTNIRKYTSRRQSNVYIDPLYFSKLYEFLSSVFKPEIVPTLRPRNERVLWSRGEFGRRNLLNRQEVENTILNNNYVIFDPLNQSPEEQFQTLFYATNICGEIGSWIYLAGLNKNCNIVLILSDWDQHWWSEVSLLNTLMNNPIKFILGERSNRNDYNSENGPSADFRLSKKGIEKLSEILSSSHQF